MVDRYAYPSFILILFLITNPAYSQYFGKNKVQYEDLEFRIYQTPHFDIYHYVEEEEARDMLAILAERWHLRHQAILADTLDQNPIIIYANQTDFKQTNVIRQRISIGLRGVTEGLRNRIVMPLTISNSETNHVLGHEMVHAFQYNMAKESDSVGIRDLSELPLWLIEGAAEYLSIGPSSSHTAIWMRDAVAQNDIPTFEDLTDNPNDYFPYRYGHAAWVYLTGIWGDGIIRPLHLLGAKNGYEEAMDSLLGYKPDTISTMWAKALKETYEPYLKDTIGIVGRRILQDDEGINIAPVLSPDGKYFTFISDRNVISIDVYLASTETGEIISQLSKTVQRSHIDDYSYLESAGAWSPHSKKYALTTFIEGKNQLLIIDIDDINNTTELAIPGVEAFKTPTWSPDGKNIVVAGLVKGQSDLYSFDLKTREVEKLTDDRYSDIQPKWSPDGSKIVFASDRGSKTDLESQQFGSYKICIYDMDRRRVEVIDIFDGANNLNPNFSYSGNSIFFLSNADGFRNLYEHKIGTAETFKCTKYFTGITGINEFTPILSVSGPDDMILYSVYNDKNYYMYMASGYEFPRFDVDVTSVDMRPSQLPPFNRRGLQVVAQNLESMPSVSTEEFKLKPYDPQFGLEAIGSGGIGVGAGQFGTSYAGGVSFLFSDILKRNQVAVLARLNGEIEDFGGQVNYVNRANRLNWGVSLSHIPYRGSSAALKRDTLQVDEQEVPVFNLIQKVRRTFEDQLTLLSQYPFSANLRIEGGLSLSRYSYSTDSINSFYTLNRTKISEEEIELESPDPNHIGSAYAAFVGDNSIMGLTSPLMGNRYRFEVQRYFSELNLWSLTADYRKYWFVKPVGFALRGMFIGRFGDDSEELYPLFLGNNYFVRGYTINSFRNNQCTEDECLSINQLAGSKIGVANAEVRFPLTGPERLTLIKSGYFFTDLVFFVDGGIALDNPENLEVNINSESIKSIPVFSAGIALRINLFGYLVLEPYMALPFQRQEIDTVFNLFISAGGW